MLLLAYVLISILLVTALAAAGRRAGLRRLCPICAGVALTWIGLLGMRAAGFPVGDTLTALLMGASVVGAMQALDRRPVRPPGAPLAWKTAFVLAGIAGGYGLLREAWPLAAGAGVLLVVLAGWALRGFGPVPGMAAEDAAERGAGVQALAEQMKNCC